MRSFPYISYLDNDGKPLHGRITFYNKGTTQLGNIFSGDTKHVLENPQPTNSIGQTEHQVFLDDSDYTIVYEKLVDGEYVFQYSSIDMFETYGIKVDGNMLDVYDVLNLRALNPNNTPQGVVNLIGYYTRGDKPPIIYKWDKNCVEDDDGGSIIKYEYYDQGRWVMVPGQFTSVDVRHWGAFPKSFYEIDDSQAYAIQMANRYALKNNLHLYFMSGCYKIISNMTTADTSSSIFAIPSDKNVTMSFSSKDFSIGQGEEFFGDITIKGEELKSDCVIGYGKDVDYEHIHFKPTSKIYLNGTIPTGTTFKNIDVYFNSEATNSNHFTVEDCNIFGQVGDDFVVDFVNCNLKGTMINSGDKITFTQCYTDIKSWNNQGEYLDYCYKNNILDIDFNNEPLKVDYTWLSKDITIRNVGNDNRNCTFKITNSHNITIDNANLKSLVISSAYEDTKVKIKDSTVTIDDTTKVYDKVELIDTTLKLNDNSTNQPVNVNELRIIGSELDGNVAIRPKRINVRDAEVWSKLDLLLCEKNLFIDSIMYGDIDPAYTIDMNRCSIYGTINMMNAPTTSVIDFSIINCSFYNNGVHKLSKNPNASYTNIIVNGRWVKNYSAKGNFVSINRDGFDPLENNHGYVYKDNYGKWLVEAEPTSFYNLRVATRNSMGVFDYSNAVDAGGGFGSFATTYNETDKKYYQNYSIYTTDINMFTIGTDLTGCDYVIETVDIKPNQPFSNVSSDYDVGTKTYLNPTSNGNATQTNVQIANIVYKGGWTWRLYGIRTPHLTASVGTTIKFMSKIEKH